VKKIEVNDIVNFWEWFKSISNDLLAYPTRADLVYQIDNRVSRLGHFDWEIGPWTADTYFFAISPGLDIKKFKLTSELVKYAPVCVGWNFLPSKPPKSDWLGIWKMKNELGQEILVDSNNWKYILYKFEDETFDMDIMIDNVEGDENTLNTAVDIGLTGYLGEETFMDLIKNIKIVRSFEEEHQNKATSVKHVKKHLESAMQ